MVSITAHEVEQKMAYAAYLQREAADLSQQARDAYTHACDAKKLFEIQGESAASTKR